MTTQPGSGPFPWDHIPSPGKVYGTATVGERGQVAIPTEARKELSFNSGDKVVVFGNKFNGAITLIRADVVEDLADFFWTKLGKLGEQAHAFWEYFLEAQEAARRAESAAETTAAGAEATATATTAEAPVAATTAETPVAATTAETAVAETPDVISDAAETLAETATEAPASQPTAPDQTAPTP
ncbi:MAG: AbrB/MazE/SpoVT family DNA-binding domain-containing protein [Propionibacteriaceae bacterium]|jgi:AbrB family looped-hinge helix DNA binding protein|nr:AbrB/MazE/SpoVT family DNA-binding domain-containing protein [Propionibacteriaceae bacterium]